MTFTSGEIDVLDRIRAMVSHEENILKCQYDYLTFDVDAACRKAVIDWCFIVTDSFEDLNRETVTIAMSILDRYLSSGKGKSAEALHGRKARQTFQLAAITSFFIAVKMVEPVTLSMDMLLKLCRGYYSQNMIVQMEQDILTALEWRISLSTTTPLEYVRHFLELLPEWKDVSDVILENAMIYNESATAGIYFSACKASAVGVACLAGALNDTYVLSALEKEAIWRQLSSKLDFDLASNEIRKVEMKLLGNSIRYSTRRPQRPSLPRSSISSKAGRQKNSSPVSVLQVI